MAKTPTNEVPASGTRQERLLFSEINRHYTMANEDLVIRRREFNKRDITFRSYIDKANWPYRSLVVDNRSFTALIEKQARLLANKPAGRMLPRESGDELGARINNELLSFQWDDNERVDNMSMLQKWSLMDLNARKYGASFALSKWHYETFKSNDKKKVFYDGPNFKPLNNRDCLPNPSYSSIKNWFQVRDYNTLQEMENVNDASRSKPIYKNLDLLKRALSQESNEGTGDQRSSNYVNYDKSLKGIPDYLGRDPAFKTLEVVTEYRRDRWITFAPRHGVILRDIPNPYNHGQIPIVMLRYYVVDGDLYGLSELEPVEKLQNAINALICQYLDAINMALYSPLKVRSTGGAVQMHTLEFGPGKKWLMSDPASDVMPHVSSIAGIREFGETYRFLVSAMQETLGESSEGVSNLAPGMGNKTATEIRDSAGSRTVRDKMSQNLLGDAIKKQMMFWYKMNQQFLFANPQERTKILRIVGPEALEYFQKMGLDKMHVPNEVQDAIAQTDTSGVNMNMRDFEKPLFPVKKGKGMVPKMTMEPGSRMGTLLVEPEDLSGDYDYIPDVKSMEIPDTAQALQYRTQFLQTVTSPAVQSELSKSGHKINLKKLLEDMLEDENMKDAGQYFEKIEQQEEQKPEVKLYENIQYRDAPPDIKRQIEAQAGLEPSKMGDLEVIDQAGVQPNQAGAGGLPQGGAGADLNGAAGLPGGFPPVSQGQAPGIVS